MNNKTIFLTALLLVSAFTFLVPSITLGPENWAFASSGHPTLFATNFFALATPPTPESEAINVSAGVYANSQQVAKADGNTPTVSPAYLGLNMSGVSFSGSQFYLYLSTNGLSQISSSDIEYAGPFNVASLTGAPTNVTSAVGTMANYTIGTVTYATGSGKGTYQSLIGPIPGGLPGGTYYIKVFDGSSGAVAVSAQKVIILPFISISPTSGPAGAAVTVSGSGFSASGVVNLTEGVGSMKFYTKNITANAQGTFVWSVTNDSAFRVHDLGLTYTGLNPVTGNQGTITYTAFDWGTSTPSNPATYTEQYRQFADIAAYNPGTNTFSHPSGTGPFGNYTISGTSVNGYVTYPLNVVANYFNPTNNVSFLLDGAALPSSDVVSLTGPFANGTLIANLTVPIATKGTHIITIVDATGNLSFGVVVQTTLAITPTKGPEGTSVSVTGYGFDPSKTVTSYWFGLAFPTGTLDPAATGNSMLLFNGTTDSTGTFTFSFSVPTHVYGGSHVVFANDSGSAWADATFTVKTAWSLSPSPASLGTPVTVSGAGLAVGSTTISTADPNFLNANGVSTGSNLTSYVLTYDNFDTGVSVTGNATGDGSGSLVAAGYPMVHYVGIASTTTFLPLNVTGTTNEGAAITSMLNTVLSNQNNILTQLGSLSTSLSNLGTAVGNLQTSVNKVDSDVTSVGNSVSQLSSSVSSGFSSTSSSLQSIQGTLGTLATSSGLQSVSSSLSNVSTFLYVAIALAAIVLILEIVILVRKR